MMKSLRSSGSELICLIAARYSKFPLKKCGSVRTEIAFAPPFSYSLAISTGVKFCLISPLLGLAFLTSAMIRYGSSALLFSVFTASLFRADFSPQALAAFQKAFAIFAVPSPLSFARLFDPVSFFALF